MGCRQRGWSAIPGLALGAKSLEATVGFNLQSLTKRQQSSLQGNGMHLPTFGAFMIYILSHVARVDKISEYICPLTQTIRPTTLDSPENLVTSDEEEDENAR